MSIPSSQRIGILMSGGLDSAVLLVRFLKRGAWVIPFYLRCGLQWEDAEVYWLRRLLHTVRSPQLAPLQVVPLSLVGVYGTHWSVRGARVPSAHSDDRAVYLPGRNVLLFGATAIRCAEQRISTIAIGTLRGNPFGDATPRFFLQLSRCLTQALRSPIRVVAPLRRLTKRELIHRARGVPFALTFSCLQPRGHQHCGRCNKCAERTRAFYAAGIQDPTLYANQPPMRARLVTTSR